jgi:hypothetical protein
LIEVKGMGGQQDHVSTLPISTAAAGGFLGSQFALKLAGA